MATSKNDENDEDQTQPVNQPSEHQASLVEEEQPPQDLGVSVSDQTSAAEHFGP